MMLQCQMTKQETVKGERLFPADDEV